MKKIFFLSLMIISLAPLPALAEDSNPFANIPKASQFLGNPREFVSEVEGKVFPVLVQFFGGVAAVYSMAQLIKAMKGVK